MSVLEIKDLHVEIEGKKILKGVNLTLKTGEVAAIMGPNGTGKSTLSAAIMGNPNYEVTQGEVLFDGVNILELEVDERARMGLFLAMQYPSEIPGITNAEFLRAAMNAGKEDEEKISQKAAELLEKAGGKAYLLNIGGNLRAIGKKGDGAKWVCPVQNPFYIDGTEEEPYAVSGEIEDVSLVTSGDYERYFTVDGVRYAHIVDPETKYPANLHRSVTILTKDSGIADALSTALFILSVEDGKELLEKMRREYSIEIEAMWVEPDHGMEYTEHFLKKVGAE